MEKQSYEPFNKRETERKISEINGRLNWIRERLKRKYFQVVDEHPVFGEMQAQRNAMQRSFLTGGLNDMNRIKEEVGMFTELASSEELYDQLKEQDPEIERLREEYEDLLNKHRELTDLLNCDVNFVVRKARVLIEWIKDTLEYMKRPNPLIPYSLTRYYTREAKEEIVRHLEVALEEYKALVGDETN